MKIRLLALTLTLSIISQLNSFALFRVPGFEESQLRLAAEVQHDSRLRLDEDGKEIDDVIFSFSTGTGLSKEVGVFNLGLNLDYTYTDYVDQNEYDDDQFSVSGALDTNIDFDYQSGNRPRFWVSFNNEVYTETDDQTGTIITRTRRSLMSGVSYHINNRTWTDLVIDYGIDSPDEDKGTDTEYADVDETTGTFRIGYSFNTKWSTFLSYSLTHNETDGLPSYNKHNASIGVQGALTPKLNGSISVGRQWQETPILTIDSIIFAINPDTGELVPVDFNTSYDLENQSSMTFNASLSWNINELTTATLSANQSYSSSITREQSVNTSTSFGINRKVNNRLSAYTSIELRWIDYENAKIEGEDEYALFDQSNQNIEEISLGLSYDFTRFQMNLSYQWSNHHTDSDFEAVKAGEDYNKSIWSLGLSSSF